MKGPARKLETPCKDMCALDKNRVCKGCGRTVDEIAGWKDMSEDQRQAVWDRLNDVTPTYAAYRQAG